MFFCAKVGHCHAFGWPNKERSMLAPRWVRLAASLGLFADSREDWYDSGRYLSRCCRMNSSRAAKAEVAKSVNTPSTPASKNCNSSALGSPLYRPGKYRASSRKVKLYTY